MTVGWARVWDVVLALAYPPYCAACQREPANGEAFFCERCWEVFPAPKRGAWSRHPRLGGRVRVAFAYSDEMRRLVWAMKFGRRRDLARTLGGRAAMRMREDLETLGLEAVVPVPLHPARVRERGYDQGKIMAAAVAEVLGLRVEAGLIRRVRHTTPQSRLPETRRLVNLERAVEPMPGRTSPPLTILLVDDVIHTGATAAACVDALQKTGDHRIYVLVACG